MATRQLTAEEIEILERRGCLAEDWEKVTVAAGFTPGRGFHHVYFSGTIRLGVYTGVVRTSEGFVFPAGVNHSSLHDASIGDNCMIRHVHVASTDIGDNVILDRVEMLSRLGDSPFANGAAVNVLTEDGARSVPLWRNLNAQTAHLLCHLKGSPAANALETIIRRDTDSLRLARSVVSAGCRIRRTGLLRNVWVGEGATIEGAASLENCYVDSSRSAPARIGEGAAAVDTIFLRSCQVGGGARLERCLVGEGARIGSGFSGTHSLFFANSQFELGEADAAMAGPFATSTHKATLVLTCQCSFATFGSGANSSNHHFKLGPRHGGVLRRGVKCGSGSYIFWPSDIGAFTTVVGRHSGHLDTSDFPFSLLIGDNGKSILVPGVNLFTSGLFRDAQKWRERDHRSGVEVPRDLVNPAILSPYVLQAMDAGIELLRRCLGFSVDIRHGGATIPAERVEPTLLLYETALVFHLGERLFTRAAAAKAGGLPNLDDLAGQINDATADGETETEGRWRDWGGMLVSGRDAKAFLADLENGRVADGAAAERRLRAMHAAYEAREWAWLAGRWRREFGEPTRAALAAFTEKWRKAVVFRHDCFIKDANKEYTPEARIGFGVEEDAATCFRRVRGTMAEHPLVALAEADRERLLALAQFIPVGGTAE